MPDRWPLASYMAYGPLPDTVPTARARTKVVLREWGRRFDLVADDMLLVVTELVSNAVTASRALAGVRPVRLWLQSNWARVLILVGDENPAPPSLLLSDVDDEHGRGLWVIDKLSDDWGWYPATSYGLTKIVWAELHPTPAPITGNDAGADPSDWLA